MTTVIAAAMVGDWIVRGIMPVISRVHLTADGTGVLEMWGDEVEIDAQPAGAGVVLRTGADAAFPLEIDATRQGEGLRLTFTNVGVAFDLVADRADAAALAAHRAAQPVAIPAPALETVPSNGLAASPPMGWNSWFGLRLRISDDAVREIADALVSSGLRDAGYTCVTLDDGWQGGRDADGTILPNRAFPDMRALGDHLHGLGLDFGIYSSPGPATCADFTGSFGHEERDARTFAGWGVDYLKYDWCSAGALYRTEDEMRGVLQRMGAALQASGRPIVFSLCQYGASDVPRWGGSVGGNLWRVSYDVEDLWESIDAIGFAEYAAPDGGWNDLDMLQIGLGGLSIAEYRTQMTVWAMRSAPLILSCDPRVLTAAELRILTNRDAIAIDQDERAAVPVRRRSGDVEVWTKQLVRGCAVAVINRGDDPVDAALRWADLDAGCPTRIRDVWSGETVPVSDTWSATLAPHESALFLLDT